MGNIKFTPEQQAFYDALPTIKEARAIARAERKAARDAADAAFISSIHANNVVDNSIVFNKRNTLENMLEEGIERFFEKDNAGFDGNPEPIEIHRVGMTLTIRSTHKGEIEVRLNSAYCIVGGNSLNIQALLDVFLPVQK